MLLQFTVENVLSFQGEAVLSLLAAPGVEHSAQQIVQIEGLSQPVLRIAALYGANASGKSNLVKALTMAAVLVARGTPPGRQIQVLPFKLDQQSLGRPCRFEFELWAEGARWSYGFAATTQRIVSEWLFRYVEDSEFCVFRRADGAGQVPDVDIGDALSLSEERRQFLKFVAEGTRHEQLFLAEARQRNVSELEPLFRFFVDLWIDRVLLSDDPDHLLISDEEHLSFASSLLRETGTGVQGIEVKEHLDGDDTLLFVHPRPGSAERFLMEADEESDGTRRLVELAPRWFTLEQNSRTVVVDELERSLHTLLSRHLIERFLASDPTSSGQLIFTTHDTNLLDLTLLPRDSIWFVEKDQGGRSSLYSLAEFKAEQLEQLGPQLEQGYLKGRFGAIPFLGDPERLGWTKKTAS